MWFVYVLVAVAIVWLGVLFYLRKIWFYRDPIRTAEAGPDGIVSPADGRVVYIKRFAKGMVSAEKLGEEIPLEEIAGTAVQDTEGWAIGIYMSPLDVHFNYCPLPGKVERIYRKSAKINFPMLDLWEYVRVVWFRKMVAMFARRYHLENERNTIFMDCGTVKTAIVLIADKFVAKIRCFVTEGQELNYSEKLGFIERGSQVDLLIFSSDVKFEVEINQQVFGGETLIARISRDENV